MNGRHKPLLDIHGKPLLAYIIERLRPRLDALILNVNTDLARYRLYGLPVVSDILTGYHGPLAGITSAMDWYRKHRPDIEWLMVAPGDTPFFPENLPTRLRQVVDDGVDIVWVQHGSQRHPLFSLWRINLLGQLEKALAQNRYSAMEFISSQSQRAVYYQRGGNSLDFANINTEADWVAVQDLAKPR